jgi:hypothetical protein
MKFRARRFSKEDLKSMSKSSRRRLQDHLRQMLAAHERGCSGMVLARNPARRIIE